MNRIFLVRPPSAVFCTHSFRDPNSLPSPNLCVKTSDAVFIPAGWDSKRLIDHLLSPDKTPWGPEATFSDVVVPPPGVERREGASEKRGSWGKGSKAEAGEEKVDMVEPEGNWLSNLSKQFIDEKLQPSEPRRRPKSRSESKVRALGILLLGRTEAVCVVYIGAVCLSQVCGVLWVRVGCSLFVTTVA